MDRDANGHMIVSFKVEIVSILIAITCKVYFTSILFVFFAVTKMCECHYLPHSYSIWHGTDNKIVLRLNVCVSVRLWTLSRSHLFVDFHQIGRRRVNPQK